MAKETSGNLFSTEEMNNMIKDSLQFQQDQPVVCLGREFPNDQARREYYREELRKKLPELRKIEGFPIGEDDDIINLSDPPYYTACPNPWLNDFIAEWEQQKVQLETEGKREADFEVKEPYASDVSEGKNNPVYNAHSYHTKVPHPAIMRYILHYTQPGDIIYDGFAGTGMTGVAAYLAGSSSNDEGGKITKSFKDEGKEPIWGKRHAILSDLSPVATLIDGVYNSPKSHQAIQKLWKIFKDAENKYGWMYNTKHTNVIFTKVAVDSSNKVLDTFYCPTCKAELTKKSMEKCWESFYDDILGEPIRTQKKVPVIINYSVGRQTYNKEPDPEDITCLNKAKSLSSQYSWTKERMMEGSEARRNDRQGLTHVHHFYFPKALIILEYIFSSCIDKEVKFWVNSQLINVSKFNRYRPGISFPYNPLSGTLYIGSQISEANVFVALENKLKKLDKVFEMLSEADNIIGVVSATNCTLPDNCIDYIFTDPPFGANISYSELNFIQESWLKVKTNNIDEAIVNDSLHKSRSDRDTAINN